MPGVDSNGDSDFDDPGDTPPRPAVPATYYDHAHCRPLCAWPVGAHYLIHDGEGGHSDAYELCPPASSPALACVADGVAGHGDAVRVSWTDGPTGPFDVQWRWMRGSQAFGTTQSTRSSSSETQISFDTAALYSSFGAQPRGVQVRVSATRYSWSSWVTAICGIICTAALNNLESRIHVIAGSAPAARPNLTTPVAPPAGPIASIRSLTQRRWSSRSRSLSHPWHARS